MLPVFTKKCLHEEIREILTYLIKKSEKKKQQLFCLIWFFTFQSTVFQLCRDGSSCVEPVLSKDKCVLLKDTKQWRWWGSNPGPLCLESSTSNSCDLIYCYIFVGVSVFWCWTFVYQCKWFSVTFHISTWSLMYWTLLLAGTLYNVKIYVLFVMCESSVPFSYNKTYLKGPLKLNTKIGFQCRWLNARGAFCNCFDLYLATIFH